MSLYTNYTQTGSSYSKIRIPVGWKQIIEHEADPSILKVLDAGCGPGNYLAMVAPHVAHITGIDANVHLLKLAKEKVQHLTNVEFKQVNLLGRLPFEDGLFDVVTCNQVIQHLVKEQDYGPWKQLVGEFRRVLKPTGKLIMNVAFRNQQRNLWFQHFFPEVQERENVNYPDQDHLIGLMQDLGFDCMVIKEKEILYGLEYYNLAGIFNEQWRHMDSFFSYVRPEELEQGLARVRNAMEYGEIFRILDQIEDRRIREGLTSWIVASKSS